MADNSHIEWTDATWQPVTGCSIVSPGCTNCYAMKLAGTRLKHHQSRANLTTMTKAGPVWNGAVRLNEQWLTQPLEWKRPRKIFVCAHGDLFHENVPDEWIDKVFAVMALTPQHTYQVLTKRAARMRDYFSRHDTQGRVLHSACFDHKKDELCVAVAKWNVRGYLNIPWPLSNVWLGVSTERQQEADERIPLLLQTPAAVRFISAEPLLGPVDLTVPNIDIGIGRYKSHPDLNWVIVGGESGPNARPMHPDWARRLRDQCKAAGVAFFFKQWGEFSPCDAINVSRQHALCGLMSSPPHLERDWVKALDFLQKTKDVDGADVLARVGKSRAGRSLDGIEYNEMPWRG